MHVLDAELCIGSAAIIVLDYRITYVYRIPGLYMVKESGHIESDGRDVMIRVRLLYKFELQMASFCTDFPSVSVVIDIFRKEYRGGISRAERLELLEYPQELRRDLRKIEHGVNLYDWSLHLRDYSA